MPDSFDIVPPRADTLMESLRATGYSLPDAVSDLIDNSIFAGAKNVWLNFHWAGESSWVSILDDGCGMSGPRLVDAMRVGSSSPTEAREPSDLGRYGLGLKTASISQARSLTVATRRAKEKGASIRRWDLDHLASSGNWQLLRVASEQAVPSVENLQQLKHGTLVVWEKLDRLVGNAGVDDSRARGQFLGSLVSLEQHLGMVFHRFMSGRNHITIWLNGREVEPWDPFLSDDTATQRLASETLGDPDAPIAITPYVLPHHSRLSTEKHRVAGGPAGWNAQQGFYIYRNRRLILPGDWLGLGFQKEEHYKLARIQVDLPNSFDHEWDIDVRKSRARPPLSIQGDLKRIAGTTRKRAVEVYRHRGKTISRGIRTSPVFVWQRHVRANKVSYVVNREHPLIKGALDSPSISHHQFRQILRVIEEYVPVQQIWVDMAEGDEAQSRPFESVREQELVGLIRSLYAAFITSGMSHDEALGRLATTEAIGDRYELVEPTINELLRESSVE